MVLDPRSSMGASVGLVGWCARLRAAGVRSDSTTVRCFRCRSRSEAAIAAGPCLSRDHFGGHRSVRQFAVAPRSLPASIGFVAQASSPVALPRAVARRGVGNGGQVAADRRQFANVVGRSGDGRHEDSCGPSRPATATVRGQRQDPRADRQTSITRSPQAVSRQPQTSGQTAAESRQPLRSDQRGSGDRSQPVMRRPQSTPTPTPAQTPRTVTDRRSTDRIAASRERGHRMRRRQHQRARTRAVVIPPRARATSGLQLQQAPAQPIVPVAPQPSKRPQSGTATRRSEPIRPVQAAQPDNSEPRFSRQSGGPVDTPRPAAPRAAAAPQQAPQRQERQERQPAPPREERPAQPRQERQNEQERSRGHEKQQQSSASDNQRNRGGDDHHRR